ncbi:MAG: outer membrane beta-barrel protein [Mangrovibacterium sp.]
MRLFHFKILLFLLLLPGSMVAQYTVRGQLMEVDNYENKSPLEYASARLSGYPDSVFIKGMNSRDNGMIEITGLRSGVYLLEISFIGLTKESRVVEVKNKDVDLGIINMWASTAAVEEVVVKGVAAQVGVKNDTVEYNAVAFKVTENAVAEDLLKKMPGIDIDANGRIYVNGEEVTKIRINGKRFFGGNTKMATKNLPADLIDKIQVIDEQSEMAKLTGFEDGETTKTINIVIREDKKRGLTANFSGGYGSDNRYETNGIVNVLSGENISTFLAGINNTNNNRIEGIGEVPVSIPGMAISRSQLSRGITISETGAFNVARPLNGQMKLEANYSFGSPATTIRQQATRENFRIAGSQFYNRFISTDRSNNVHDAGFRWEWKLTPSATLVIEPEFIYNGYQGDQQTTFHTITIASDTISDGNIRLYTSGRSVTGNTSVVFIRRFSKKGRSFSVNLRGNFSDDSLDGINKNLKINYKNGQETSRNDIDLQYSQSSGDLGYYFRVSYIEPIVRNRLLEFSYTQRSNKKELDKESYQPDDQTGMYTEFVPEYSSIYSNLFHNYQFGLSFRSYHKRYRYIIGVVAEPSSTKSESPLLEDISRKVFNFSPTANLTINFSNKKYLKFNYRGTTNQPTVSQLQPASDVSNPMNERRGNPGLKPRFVHSLKSTYSAYNKKNFSLLTTNLAASLTQNAIVNYTEYVENGNGKQLTYPVNVNGEYNIYGNVLYNCPLFDRQITLHTNSTYRFASNKGFTKDDETKEILKNNIRNLRLGERMYLMWQGDRIDLNIGSEVFYNIAQNDVNELQNRETTDWNLFNSLLIHLPASFTLNSEINSLFKYGYAEGVGNKEVIWNLELEKVIFRNRKGAISLKAFDILQQRLAVVRLVGSNYIEDSEYNTLKSYFLLCFSYKFDCFGNN